jgi:hypothetical protein
MYFILFGSITVRFHVTLFSHKKFAQRGFVQHAMTTPCNPRFAYRSLYFLYFPAIYLFVAFLVLLTLEDEGTTLPRNVARQLPSDTL